MESVYVHEARLMLRPHVRIGGAALRRFVVELRRPDGTRVEVEASVGQASCQAIGAVPWAMVVLEVGDAAMAPVGTEIWIARELEIPPEPRDELDDQRDTMLAMIEKGMHGGEVDEAAMRDAADKMRRAAAARMQAMMKDGPAIENPALRRALEAAAKAMATDDEGERKRIALAARQQLEQSPEVQALRGRIREPDPTDD